MKFYDPKSGRAVRILPKRKRKQRRMSLQLTGSECPSAELKRRAVSFWERFSQEFTEAESLVRTGSKRAPSRTRSGLGLEWLKWFADYKGEACLLFPFRTNTTPRGVVTFNYKAMPAHRAMCLMVHKLPPDGKPMALHRCGNGHLGCVNGNHLYWGDASDNTKDAHRHRKEGKPTALGPKAGPPKWARSANR